MGQYIANLLFGTLIPHETDTTFLIAFSNGETITAFVSNSLVRFWKTFKEKILLPVTDATPYNMGFAGEEFESCVLHSMVSVTCLRYGIRHLCEKIRELYPDVNP